MQHPFKRQKNPVKLTPNFYAVLLAHSRNIIFVKDRDFRIVYANPAFLGLYAPEQRDSIIGSVSADTFLEEEAKVFFAEDRKAFETGFSELVEEITDYTGRTRIFQTQKIRFIDENNGEPRILGIGTDITKHADREKLLAKSNIALENFAAMAAHDLRSPLSAAYSSLEYIQQDPNTSLGPKAGEHMQLVTESLLRLIDQVGQLLETCKIPDTVSESAFTECDLSTLFEEVRFSLFPHIEKTRAKILSVELPCLKVNKPLFRQLLANLIENSLKYRGPETPIVILRHEIRDGKHLFSIEDNGVGIAPENREKIFMLGSQVDSKAEGYGIGLSLCRYIVESHGGRIWVDPDYTAGAKICFTMPAGTK